MEDRVEKIQEAQCQISSIQDTEIRNVMMGVIGSMGLWPVRFSRTTRESDLESWGVGFSILPDYTYKLSNFKDLTTRSR